MDRLLGTLLGVAIAVAITWATSYRFPERLLRAQNARVGTAIAAVEGHNADGTAFTPAGRRARVELSYELTHHLSVLDRAATEDPRLTSLKDTDDVLIDDGYTALAKAWV